MCWDVMVPATQAQLLQRRLTSRRDNAIDTVISPFDPGRFDRSPLNLVDTARTRFPHGKPPQQSPADVRPTTLHLTRRQRRSQRIPLYVHGLPRRRHHGIAFLALLTEDIQPPKARVHETSARNVPYVVIDGLRLARVHRGHPPVPALGARAPQKDIVVANHAAREAGRSAEVIAEAVGRWVRAEEEVAPGGAHYGRKLEGKVSSDVV